MKNVSCFAESGGPEAAAGRLVASVYPGYSYDRPLPASILSANPSTPAGLRDQYAAWNAEYDRGAECALIELQSAVLYDRSVYVPDRGEWAQLAETNRSIDRPWKTDLDVDLLQQALRPSDRTAAYVYFGSVGSENYAHWLVDDLTRAKALLCARERWSVVFDEHFESIDRMRESSLRALGPPFDTVEVIFIDRKRPHFFDRLFYVTPDSYHPFLKCADGFGFLNERLRPQPAPDAPKKLFVGRSALWRNLMNADEVTQFFVERSFHPVTIDWQNPPSFAEQVRIFAGAEIVVGVAGASMANTIFCAAGTRVFYLAGEGFTDPFFWDMAAVKQHEYNVCFGTPWKPERPTFSSFSVDADQLRALPI